VLFLHDLTRAGRDAAYDAAEGEIATQLPPGVTVIDVWNKADVVGGGAERLDGRQGATDASQGPRQPGQCRQSPEARVGLRLSAVTGQGLEALRQTLLQAAGWQTASEGVFIARARHVQALQHCAAHLDGARALLQSPAPALDLLAEELRLAHQALGEVTGIFTTEDLLGEIFGKFCIGK
jgi:tRNA modification GTPase